jgi:hypothetical protein
MDVSSNRRITATTFAQSVPSVPIDRADAAISDAGLVHKHHACHAG